MKYIKPEAGKPSFTCPQCGVVAKQDWDARTFEFNQNFDWSENSLRTAKCQHCNLSSVWILETMFYPDNGNAPLPNEEMPDPVKKIYLEASSIANKSPKGAAALLRLSIQILCKELGEPGNHINTDIKSLVAKGLPEIVQKSLDVVRVTGNEAVHPGQIAIDDIKVVNRLFELVNVIVDYMIALPNQVSGIYDALPEDKKNGINKRDR